jgi:hypothetical protein
MVAGRDKVADTGSRYLGSRTRDETGCVSHESIEFLFLNSSRSQIEDGLTPRATRLKVRNRREI